MKKFFILICSISIILTFAALQVSATQTEFVDKADADFTKVTEKIGIWQFEPNEDVDKTLYSKGEGMKDKEISLIYKMNGDIKSFKIDTLNLSGLGDANLDVAVHISSNGTNWDLIEISVTDQVMDDAYISPDIAYWFNSSVSNKNAIPAGTTYLKISLLPFTRKDMAAWSTVIDDVYITYDGITPTKAPASSELKSSEPFSDVEPTEVMSEEGSSEDEISELESEEDLKTDEASSEVELESESKTPLIIGGIILGILAIGAVAFFFHKHNKAKD